MIKKIYLMMLVLSTVATNYASSLSAADRRLTGIIAKIDCGDATNLSLRLSNRSLIIGACMAQWCESLCGPRMEQARNRTIGKRISASVRVINMEEEEEGVLSNEFYNITLE